MRNTIFIKWNELQQQINLKNFYMGESAKRKDADADTIQSSTDDKELFIMLVQQAANELFTAVALRFPYLELKTNEEYIEFTFESKSNKLDHLLPLLQQSIVDYLVNEVRMHWLLLNQPQMAQTNISLRNSLYNNVQQMFAKFYNTEKVRRRATNLAGI